MTLTPKTHNVVSYVGAWLVLPIATLLFAANSDISGGIFGVLPSAMLPLALWCVHFARRTSEALFVHHYGKAVFPWGDALIEYVYYWGFGVWNAYALVQRARLGGEVDWIMGAGFVLFVVSQIGNARSHWLLRELRTAAPGARVIPRGFLFELVSCPHYLFEILSWVGFALVVRTLAAWAFVGVAAAILAAWATQRHRAYRRDFDGLDGRSLYPARRRALLPFIY